MAAVIGETVAIGSLIGLILGAVGGLVSGCVTDQRKKQTIEKAKLALPHRLRGAPAFSEPLLTLARTSSKFNRAAFRALADKISAMLKMYSDIAAAAPSSVTPAMAHVGTQYEVGVQERLQGFYRSSGVVVVQNKAADRGPGKGERDMEPVHRDMKLAHEVLMGSTMAVADAINDLARDKLSQAVAEKEFRFPHTSTNKRQ